MASKRSVNPDIHTSKPFRRFAEREQRLTRLRDEVVEAAKGWLSARSGYVYPASPAGILVDSVRKLLAAEKEKS